MPHTRKSVKFVCSGVDLNAPRDLQPPGKFPLLYNVRSLVAGSLTSRSGSTTIATNPNALPNHSIRRLNYAVTSAFSRIVGAGPNLYSGTTGSLTQIDTGYSGNPLSQSPFRPNSTPQPYMYIADSSRMSKVNVAGQRYAIGSPMPTVPPGVVLGTPNYQFISNFQAVGGWAPFGTGGAISTPARFSSTIAQIVYDSGTTGWCSISPAAMNSNYQPGSCPILQTGTETVKIVDVFQAVSTTTIQAITYDSGSSGPCSVTLAAPSPNLAPYCLLQLGGETVQVQSVTVTPSGIPSFRCTTASNHTAGATVTGLPTFRCFTTGTHTTTETITGNVFQSSVTAGIGGVQITSDPINLNIINSRPISPDDYIHISVLMDIPTNLVQGQVLIDIGDGSFTQNYLYYNFTPNLLEPNVLNTLTASQVSQNIISQQIIQNNRINYTGAEGIPGVPSDAVYAPGYGPGYDPTIPGVVVAAQSVPGSSQWTELVFKVSQLIRVGSSQSVNLSNANAFQISLNCSGPITMLVGSWWISGTYGADVGVTGTPYQYSYRYRASSTGAVSLRSPSNLVGQDALRDAIVVSVTASTDPQIDTIDLFRFGGAQNTWNQIGSYSNTNQSITDTLPDSTITVNQQLPFDDYQPFPITDLPRAGVCNTCGTTVNWVSGDTFNTNWAPGSIIIIAGTAYTIYSVTSSIFMTLVQSAGANTNASFSLPQATIVGQPLRSIWFFGGQGFGSYMMAVGDPYNPGFLHWSKGNSPDTSSDSNLLEITPPSEPLMGGVTYNGNCYVFSSQRVFQILPNFANTGAGQSQFISQEVPVGKGLFSAWGLAVGPSIYFISTDGIWSLDGGGLTPLSGDLAPLFPKSGTVGQAVNGYNPPNFSLPQYLRLFYANNYLFFCYQDTGGVFRSMKYDFQSGGWFPETYTPVPYCFYAEEGSGVESTLIGGADGAVRQITTGVYFDDAIPVACQIRTPSLDMGDSRNNKLYTDSTLDTNPNNATITELVYFDNWASTLVPSPSTMTGVGRQQFVSAVASQSVALHQNMAVDLQWSGANVEIWEWQPAAQMQPYSAAYFTSQYNDMGNQGYWHLRDGMFTCITNTAVSLVILVDGVATTINIPVVTNGVYQKVYYVVPALKGRAIRFTATSTANFVIFPDETYINMKAWGSTGAFTKFPMFADLLSSTEQGAV